MKYILIAAALLVTNQLSSQHDYYFPPNNSDEWETADFESFNFCNDRRDELMQELEDNETKAFLMLKSGRIVIEEYFDGFHRDSSWIWFSAGKSLSAFLLGLAQEDGHLNIEEPSKNYLGDSWSNLSPEQEEAVLIRHHMSMTTGLDYTVSDPFCTDMECLDYLNEPGTHWFYHNAPYSLLRQILENASSQNINVYTFLNMHLNIGMDGLWVPVGYNNFYVSTARSMARFGLLMLNNGDWDGKTIMEDKDYLRSMTQSSQQENPSYGLLWWLNGKSHYKLPGSDIVFNGPLIPDAFPDMYCAVGAESQLILVIPSEDMVVVRMGLENNNDLVPIRIITTVSEIIQSMICPISTEETSLKEDVQLFPNPLYESCATLRNKAGQQLKYELYNSTGQLIERSDYIYLNEICVPDQPGIYFVSISDKSNNHVVEKLIKY